MTPVDLVLSRVRGARTNGDGHLALCPAHEDRGASLSIGTGRDGRALVNCFAGCKAPAIVAALGLTLADLMPEKDPRARRAAEEQRIELRRLARANAPETIRKVLRELIESARVERLRRSPYDTPHVRGADIRNAYDRVVSQLGITLPGVVRNRRWEGYPPHDQDPLWPLFFARGLEIAQWRWADVMDVEPRRTRRFEPTPGGTPYDELAAAIGARLLRDHARRAVGATHGKAAAQ